MIERKHRSSSSSLNIFRGVKSLLSRRESSLSRQQSSLNNKSHELYAREGVAVTLTTDFARNDHGPVSLLQANNLSFLPSRSVVSSFDTKAYVHYEPRKTQVILGTSPDAKHSKLLKLTVQQFAWLIQYLNEEQLVHDSVAKLLSSSSHDLLFNLQPPMLGVLGTDPSRSLGKRLIRFVRRKKNVSHNLLHRQCIFMLPKALLIQAANYIPKAKPLPPSPNTLPDSMHLLYDIPHQIISASYLKRLKRYCHYVSFCSHELLMSHSNNAKLMSPSPPDSIISSNNQCDLIPIRCADCSLQCGPESVQQHPQPHQKKQETFSASTTGRLFSSLIITQPSSYEQQTVMFPISYINYINNKPTESQIVMSSAVAPERKKAFDTLTRHQRPQAFSAFQYIPPERNASTSDISSIEEESIEEDLEEDDCSPQKYGYVAVDNEAEEILVVFPGMAVSQYMFENASFVPAPWIEPDTPSADKMERQLHEDAQEDPSPWVLECALTAWRRCEMKVVTLLMRLCATMPSRYKVVIIGHSLGGAVACLCAYSLRTTKLLLNRHITVCTIFSPRVANKTFLQTLSTRDVNVIRITDHMDLMARLPPRMCGLLHAGDSTVILSPDIEDGYVLENMQPEMIEDTLHRTCSANDVIGSQSKHSIWGIELDNDSKKCISNLLQ
ncbi:hypothetical protein RMCBS344292_17808 [Rhizopus microsporus]|nr:hypothetical protein RMCBS344292_17808 [Rhizopus microsporus]